MQILKCILLFVVVLQLATSMQLSRVHTIAASQSCINALNSFVGNIDGHLKIQQSNFAQTCNRISSYTTGAYIDAYCQSIAGQTVYSWLDIPSWPAQCNWSFIPQTHLKLTFIHYHLKFTIFFIIFERLQQEMQSLFKKNLESLNILSTHRKGKTERFNLVIE